MMIDWIAAAKIRERMELKVLFFRLVLMAALAAVVIMTGGCVAGLDYNKPQNAAERFPVRNQDPTIGLVIWNGTAPTTIEVYDQANRLIEQASISGASRWIQYNGQYGIQAWAGRLEPGSYRIVFRPFFYTVRLTGRYRIDLPEQSAGIYVGANPSACYEAGRYWGWCLRAGVNIPEGTDPVPLMDLFKINLPFLGR